MGGSNRFATLSRQRARNGTTKRSPNDAYETPTEYGETLLRLVKFAGPIWEPAAGAGRLVQAIRAAGLQVKASDIRSGTDFLKVSRRYPGDILTNPPYGDLADAFTKHALELADGRVALLMQQGYLWGEQRSEWLWHQCKPSHVIVIPERIYFFENNQPIEAQFFSHCWIVWPERQLRGAKVSTEVVWAARQQEVRPQLPVRDMLAALRAKLSPAQPVVYSAPRHITGSGDPR